MFRGDFKCGNRDKAGLRAPGRAEAVHCRQPGFEFPGRFAWRGEAAFIRTEGLRGRSRPIAPSIARSTMSGAISNELQKKPGMRW
jgi:hypothetical protein